MKTLVTDTGGATAIEYALLASLIAMVIIGSLTAIGTSLSGFFVKVSSNLR